jgi:ribosomal protein S3
MGAGAKGVEILISGKIPGARAKNWRFFTGHLKKCGEVSVAGVRHAYKTARLKSGVVGVKVSIMPPTVELPDEITLHEEAKEEVVLEEVTDAKLKKEMEDVREGKASLREEEDVIEHAKEDKEKVAEEPAEKPAKKKAVPKRSAPTAAEKQGAPKKKAAKKATKKAPAKKKAAKKKTVKKKAPAKKAGGEQA